MRLHHNSSRRDFLKIASSTASLPFIQSLKAAQQDELRGEELEALITPFDKATGYNNFYEFGTDKRDPAKNSKNFVSQPWTLRIDGLVKKAKTFDVEDLKSKLPRHERIYRLRCVETWAMVIPWIGIELSDILKQVEILGSAKYVAFETLLDQEQMPAQKQTALSSLAWPYVEGLRLDEAMHPLTLMVTGMYGKNQLPNQNGAPIRLMVPWKYGFKSIKSIVRISLTETEPPTSWNKSQPSEYGFYANVNPGVHHPRWSQAEEKVIDASFLGSRRKTELFNGYSKQVAHLYQGMDLREHF